MLRGFAATRAVPMGPEFSLGGPTSVSSRRNTGLQSALRRLDAPALQPLASTDSSTSSISRVVLGFCLVLLVLGVLPASFVFWACIVVLVFTCLRLRLQAQHLQRALEQDQTPNADAARGDPGYPFPAGGPIIRMIPGGGLLLLHTEPRVALEQLNMRLLQLDEEMGLAATEDDGLMARRAFPAMHVPGASGQGARATPVSDADIAALPCYPYKLPRKSTPAAAAINCEDTGMVGPAAPQASKAQAAEAAGFDTPSSGRVPRAASGATLTAATAPNHGAASALPATSTTQAAAVSWPRLGNGDDRAAGANAGLLSTSFAGAPAAAALSAEEGRARRSGSCGGSCGAASDGIPADGAGAGAHSGLTCPVCLDPVAEGAIVMTLPCLHQFHASCITPWLRQQGQYASCPMCKTPVFR